MRKKNIPWDSVLENALRDGLYAAEVARLVGVAPSTVHDACERRGITLAKSIRGRGAKLNAVMLERFRAAAIAGTRANAFCLQNDISYGSLKRLERMHGFKLRRDRAQTVERSA